MALIAATGTILSPLLLAYMTNRQRRVEKREDYKRQDLVAAQAAEAAALLLAANERVAESTAVTNEKLDVIHTLVNSHMTAAMQSEFDATVRELAVMRELAAVHEAAGRQPGEHTVSAIEVTQSKVDELRTNLVERLEQTRLADHRAAVQKGQ